MVTKNNIMDWFFGIGYWVLNIIGIWGIIHLVSKL